MTNDERPTPEEVAAGRALFGLGAKPTYEELEQRGEVLWAEVKHAWHALGEIERGARELRKSLSDGDPMRMKLLTFETMAGIGLEKKRAAGKAAAEALAHLCRFVEDPEEVATMTPEEVDAALEAEGVDVEAGRERLKERMEEIRAARRGRPHPMIPHPPEREMRK